VRRTATTSSFGRLGAVIGVLVVVASLGGFAIAAVTGRATPASHPVVLGGSIVLDNDEAPPVVDLVTGEATVLLTQLDAEVGAAAYADVQSVPADGGTYLVDRRTGTFNLLDPDDYVVDTVGHGVGLGAATATTGAVGLADGADAYILRYGPHPTVSLVDPATVATAAGKAPPTVRPLGFAVLAGPVSAAAGATAVAGGDLWVLTGAGRDCALVVLRPGARGALTATTRASGLACATSSLTVAGRVVGLATPGRLDVFDGPAAPRAVTDVVTAEASEVVPVGGSTTTLWWAARTPGTWTLVGVDPGAGPAEERALRGISTRAELAPPVLSGGRIFTLDRDAAHPALWVVDPTNGAVGTVAGVGSYPAASAAEHAGFAGAEVLAADARVIFDNPASELAVVVFTDGSHAPIVIDKAAAVSISPTGPARIAQRSRSRPKATRASRGSSTTTTTAPAAPAFSQQVDCAATVETPYAPTSVAVVPSSESALVTWSYHVLDPQDCEPDTWTVQVTATGGARQPSRPTQLVDGQEQLQFLGLRPTTTYRVVVTAHINNRSTASAPVTFRTSSQGPDAPTSVRTSVDSSGDWVVSWSACRPRQCIVAADQWIVTGAACGPQFVGTPPTVEIAAGETTVTIPPGALLGTSLRFSVEGALSSGLRGNPTLDPACVQSFRPPNPATIVLHGATAAGIGQSVDATLSVTPAPGPGTAGVYGSRQPDFVYHLAGRSFGPTTATSVPVDGLTPGRIYQPTVTVFPAGHRSASVVVQGRPLHRDLQWSPALAVHVAGRPDADPDTGTATLTFTGLAPGVYDAAVTWQCGSVGDSVNLTVRESVTAIPAFDLETVPPGCSLTTQLTDPAPSDPYGGPSPTLKAAWSFPPETVTRFDATYSQTCPIAGFTSGCPIVVAVGRVGTAAVEGGSWTVTGTEHGVASATCAGQLTTPQAPTGQRFQVTGSGCRPTRAHHLNVVVSWQYYGVTSSAAARVRGRSGKPLPPPTTTTLPPPTTTTPTTLPRPTTTTTPTTVPRSTTSTGPTVTTTTTTPTTTTPTTTTPGSTTPTTTTPTSAATPAAGPSGGVDGQGPALAVASTPVPPGGAGSATIGGIAVALAAAGALCGVTARRRRRDPGRSA
jgi:hypothetical protein